MARKQKRDRLRIGRDRKRQTHLPPPFSWHYTRFNKYVTKCVTSITGVLSTSDHVGDVISRCAQSLYATRVQRTHGVSHRVLSIGIPSSPDSCRRRALGGVSPRQLTGNESTPPLDGVRSVMFAIFVLHSISTNIAVLQTKNYARPFF